MAYPTLHDVKLRHVRDTLAYVNGSKPRAAALLGVTLKTVYALAKAAGVPPQPPGRPTSSNLPGDQGPLDLNHDLGGEG